ncbi:MAG: hypothetical protein KDD43_17525, partial [Bdellovibrionales bacterium]|nr:hypothetical protein [Bdellovibrionales bacterium]
IELDQNHVQALNFLAYTYAELNQNLEEAEELARKALMLQPKDGYILDTLGWVLYKQDKIKESILTLETAYKLKSTESIIAEHLGDAYYRYDLLEKARQMYLKAVDFEKDKSKVQKIKDKIAVIENTKPFPNDADQRRPASSDSP